MVSKLKLKRIELGLKQKDVAKQVGITPQYLMNLENGKSKNPSIKVMKEISAILDCPVQELFFGTGAATLTETK
ncbi:anaerobic benzoate catabolism transcriptional regulator [Anaerotignum neopropionicum]|uniref:Anaerobic benzoate catabolism transcriptional regulator n=1 Tax=Anaerotignum neopropionicum TaxID=36847 RepID=A0A136WEA0_9FIRM|nr:helix-turn-helix transcriptional regulator [Anaerotignum neopropionicum]KXL52824.1 anaerobic benzoate catabolism transcriptional regulator [Anaerotignum neopropionicum]